MLLCGLQKVTLIDFPGEVAAILFFPGCNLRCPYCHNPELVVPPFPDDLIPIEDAFRYLRKRKNVLGGVVISGGEPLSHPEIPDIVGHLRSLDLKVKLDTNGTFPEALSSMTCDYIAMDIKTSLRKYDILGGSLFPDLKERVTRSIEWILDSGIAHVWRTVVVPGIVEPDDIPDICSLLKKGERLFLAQFREDKTLDETFSMITPYPIQILKSMQAAANDLGIDCRIRE
jgi:pyruvate formate lyase activating enzyme